MGGKAVHQMATVFDQDPSDVMYGVRLVGGDPVNFSIERSLVGYPLLNDSETLSNAEVLALGVTPQVILTGVPDKIIIPRYAIMVMTNGTINFTTNTTLLIGSTSTIDDTHYTLTGSFPLVAVPKSVTFPALTIAGQITSVVSGDSLSIKVKTGNPAAGDGGLNVFIYYELIDA